MSKHKCIEKFTSWVRLNESDDQERELIERADGLTADFEADASRSRLETSTLMIWFHGMMDLYDNSDLKGLIFMKMKPIWAKYFKQIYPLLSTDNKELTRHDIMEIKRYKQLSTEESHHERSANDLLKDLGLL